MGAVASTRLTQVMCSRTRALDTAHVESPTCLARRPTMKPSMLRTMLLSLPVLVALLAAVWIAQSGSDTGQALPKPVPMMSTPF